MESNNLRRYSTLRLAKLQPSAKLKTWDTRMDPQGHATWWPAEIGFQLGLFRMFFPIWSKSGQGPRDHGETAAYTSKLFLEFPELQWKAFGWQSRCTYRTCKTPAFDLSMRPSWSSRAGFLSFWVCEELSGTLNTSVQRCEIHKRFAQGNASCIA